MAERPLFRRLRAKAGVILPGLIVLALILLLQGVGVPAIDRAGALLFDSYQRAKPRPYRDAGVKIVDIDDETLRRLGQWPWPRTDIAELTQRLTDAGAANVVFDIVFSEPDRTSPAKLADRVRRAGGAGDDVLAALARLPDNDAVLADGFGRSNVVLAFFLSHYRTGGQVEPKAGFGFVGSPPRTGQADFTGAIQPLPALRAAANGLGFVSLPPDGDGIVRRAPLLATQNGQLLPSLSLEALRTAYRLPSVKIKSSDASGEYYNDGSNVVAVQVGDSVVPTTHAGALFLYYSPRHADRVVPAWRILSGAMSDAALRRSFEGRIVLIGTGAQGLHDTISTPLEERELGVMVHAQALEQIITGAFLEQPDWARGAERAALLLLGLAMALSLPWLGATRGAVLGLVLVGGMAAGSWTAFSHYRLLLDPTWPVLGLTLVYVVETALTYYREERRRAYIHQAFDRYLSPELVRRIAEDPGRLELGGEEREMTVLFCDIRGFSRLSEQLTPQQTIQFLIAFLTPMCDILLARKATIDKFIGDAVLAFWNAPLDDPDQYANAARGALGMTRRLREINVEMRGRTGTVWPGEVGIGTASMRGPAASAIWARRSGSTIR